MTPGFCFTGAQPRGGRLPGFCPAARCCRPEPRARWRGAAARGAAAGGAPALSSPVKFIAFCRAGRNGGSRPFGHRRPRLGPSGARRGAGLLLRLGYGHRGLQRPRMRLPRRGGSAGEEERTGRERDLALRELCAAIRGAAGAGGGHRGRGAPARRPQRAPRGRWWERLQPLASSAAAPWAPPGFSRC